MKTEFKRNILIAIIFAVSFTINGLQAGEKSNPKRIYFSYTLHGNMNYDRYPKSTIWDKFPETYQNILDFMIQHPEFKGQMQLSGQTFKTVQIVAPEFLKQAKKLQQNGQIDFTGTFYSEPVNVCMDGETNFLNAKLGCLIITQELASTSGFFVQEHAWNPQLPYILNKAGVDWVPIRTAEQRYKPYYAIGLDGSKIIAVPTDRHVSNYKDVIDLIPDNGIILMGGDFEMPGRFIDAYNEVIEINKERSDIQIEWIRVSDYLKKFPVEIEEFINNTELAGIREWDSYSRWTADPLDIKVHTLTKEAMAGVRAAKIAVFAGTEYATQSGLTITKNPDTPIKYLESYEPDKGIDWDIEQASDYPDIEYRYFSRNGEVTLLSRAEHLLAWATNSDARGWWPLFERRQERMESFKQIINISRELILNALSPIGASIDIKKQYDKVMLVYNAEKAREVTFEIKTKQSFQMESLQGKELDTKIFREGKDYFIRSRINLPDYGYKAIGLIYGGRVEIPKWEEGVSVQNDKFLLKYEGDKVNINIDGKSLEVSVDSFQLRVLAEMVKDAELEGWRDGIPYGEARVSICKNDLFPKLRIDWQIDWAVHLRQEYELEPNNVNCKWSFFIPHPTLIRKKGKLEPGHLFPPEGLMARLNSNEPGKIFYDVPFGVTDHDYPSPSYVCMQDFSLLQHKEDGIMIAAKTGSQAVQVDELTGSMALVLGASTASGPKRNPEMKVDHYNIFHEQPFYSEFFQGEYLHEFFIYPFEGSWQDAQVSDHAKRLVNDIYLVEIPRIGAASDIHLPDKGSFVTIDNQNVEITCIDNLSDKLIVRLNERNNKSSRGEVKIGKYTEKFDTSPFEIIEVELK